MLTDLAQSTVKSASAKLRQPAIQMPYLPDIIAKLTPSWVPQVMTPNAPGYLGAAGQMAKQEEARLKHLQQQAITQEQQRQQMKMAGLYPLNEAEVQAGQATNASVQPIYYDPNTGQYSYTKQGAQTTAGGGGGGGGDVTHGTTDVGGGGGTVAGATMPEYDYAVETDLAYRTLQNFYNKLLDFSGGRLDLAKRTLEYIYQQGIRETAQEYEQSRAEQELLFPKETAEAQTGLNRRGVYFSGFGKEDMGSVQKSQDIRKLAVERAKENRESRLTSERDLDLEKSTGAFEEEKFGLERQRRQEAQGMARDKYAIQAEKYGGELTKAVQGEARAASTAGNQAAGGGSTAGGSTSNDKTRFRSWMQTTGKQNELDVATRGSKQEGADFYALMNKYKGQY